MFHRTALVAAFTLVGCGQAAAPVAYPAPQPVTVSAPQAELWRAAIDLVTEMELPISTLDAGSGYMRTDRAYLPEPAYGVWWDCGGGVGLSLGGDMPAWEREMLGRNETEDADHAAAAGMAPLGRIAMAFLERSGRTQLRLIVSELSYPGTGRECRSKGVFEGHLLSLVVERWRSLFGAQERN